MANETIQCPKCKGEMAQGFVPDYSYAAILAEAWHPGQPTRSFWTRITKPSTEGVPIAAFRCQECGFLEFYADAKFKAQ